MATAVRSLEEEMRLRERVFAAYRRARTEVFDVREEGLIVPLTRSQQRIIAELEAAEEELRAFRRISIDDGLGQPLLTFPRQPQRSRR